MIYSKINIDLNKFFWHRFKRQLVIEALVIKNADLMRSAQKRNSMVESNNSMKACSKFDAKSRTGPLASYCRNCNLHKVKCGGGGEV